jgi:hypothetical protein
MKRAATVLLSFFRNLFKERAATVFRSLFNDSVSIKNALRQWSDLLMEDELEGVWEAMILS